MRDLKKHKAARKAWYEANKEYAKQHRREYLAANKEKTAATKKAWKQANPDKVVQYRATFIANNPGASAAHKRKQYLKKKETNPDALQAEWQKRYNPEKAKAAAKQWKKRNPDRVAAMTAVRKASELKATPAWANKFFIREAYRLSRLRTKVTGFEWEVDHIVPLKSPIVCGLHVENNLRVIPAVVNNAKNNKLVEALL